MNIISNPIEKNIDYSSLKLSFLESSVLKIYALDYSNNEARKILDINQEEYCIVTQTLLRKYGAVDMFHIIKLALYHNHINLYDLVKDEVKKTALTFSAKLNLYFERHTINQPNNNNNNNNKKNLSAFLDALKQEFINNLHSQLKPNLTQEELNYCILRLKAYDSINTVQIIQILRANNGIEKDLTLKLQANNFFNAIRKIFEFGLFDLTQFA
jgi:hypothetical protein